MVSRQQASRVCELCPGCARRRAHEEPLGSARLFNGGTAELSLRLRFGDVRGLRSFLSLHDLELHCIAFLQALIAFRTNGTVMDEHVRPIVSPDKAVSFGVVKPLDRTFQVFHVLPLPCVSTRTRGNICSHC